MRHCKQRCLGILTYVGLTLSAAIAEEPRTYSVKPLLDVAPSIQVGDTIEFEVEEAPVGEVSAIEFNSEVAGDKEKSTLFEWGWILNPFISSDSSSQTSKLQEKPSIFFRFRASPVKSGSILLPKQVLKNARGEVIGYTKEWKAEVLSALQDQENKASEMRPPAAVAVPVWTVFGIVVLILGILALVFFGIRNYLKKKPVKKEFKKEVILPEHDEALKALDELMEKRYYDKSLFKAHYFGISEILKHYVARRYDFDAEEKTSREFLRHLEIEIGIKDQILDDLEKLFEKLDWVKFTDHVPQKQEALQLIQQARDWVQRTRSQPQISAEAVKK